MKTLSCTLVLIGMCFILGPGFGQNGAHHRSGRLAAHAPLAGTYTRVKRHRDENQSAILDVKQSGPGTVRFDLTALWWSVGRGDSPHNGEIEATIPLHNHVAVYKNGDYRLTLKFRAHTVVLTESGSNPDFGASVSAAGTYRRTRRASR